MLEWGWYHGVLRLEQNCLVEVEVSLEFSSGENRKPAEEGYGVSRVDYGMLACASHSPPARWSVLHLQYSSDWKN